MLLCYLLLVPLVAVHGLTDNEKSQFPPLAQNPRDRNGCGNWVAYETVPGRDGNQVVIRSNGIPRPIDGTWQEVIHILCLNTPYGTISRNTSHCNFQLLTQISFQIYILFQTLQPKCWYLVIKC